MFALAVNTVLAGADRKAMLSLLVEDYVTAAALVQLLVEVEASACQGRRCYW